MGLISIEFTKFGLLKLDLYYYHLVSLYLVLLFPWTFRLEIATAQRTRPRAVVGAPRSVATKICITSQHQRRVQNFFYNLQLLLVIFFL